MPSPDFGADDPYDVLGVPSDAPMGKIEQRAQDLIAQHDDGEVIEAISEAYETIKEQPRRERIKEQPRRERISGTLVIPLLVSARPSTLTVGEEVTLTVEDDQGTRIDGAGIRIGDNRKGQTGPDGRDTIRLTDPGTVEFTVEKRHSDPDTKYRDGSVDVTVERRRSSLRFARCPDAATVGDEISVRVTDADGNGVSGVTVESAATVADPTDANGETTLTLASAGQVRLTASKGRSSTTEYDDATTTVSVDPRRVALDIAQYPDTVAVDDDVTVRVVDGGGDPVDSVAVSTDTDSATTDADGFATLSFAGATPGSARIRAEKSDTADETFTTDTVAVTVTQKQLSLRLRCLTDSPVVGEPTTFEVTDVDGDPVADAFVSGGSSSNAVTDADGTATVTFDQAGPVTVFASKDDRAGVSYGGAECRVDVERRRESLRIEAFDTNVEVGDDVTVYVVDGDSEPVAGAEVTGDSATTATTGPGGRATIQFDDHGKQSITVTKDPDETARYDGDSATLIVDEPTRTVSMVDVPDDVNAGEEVELRVVDESGDPVAGAQVTARGRTATTVETDADGYARFPVDVDRTQFVEVSARTYGDEFEDFDQTMIRVVA
ncbi:MAG: carboxypeptidase regulatory-like domain-containing protein [Haloplanus sp.]